jgi:hypothetical protein
MDAQNRLFCRTHFYGYSNRTGVYEGLWGDIQRHAEQPLIVLPAAMAQTFQVILYKSPIIIILLTILPVTE